MRLSASALSLLLLALLGAAERPAPAPAPAPAPERTPAAEALRAWVGSAGGRRALEGLRGGLEAALARAGPRGPSARCREDAERVVGEARAGAAWALRMLDAAAKAPEGLLAGAWEHLGHWDECVGVRDRPFHGQMCLLRVGPEAGEEERLAREVAAAEAGALPEGASLALAACVPSTCSPADVQALFATLLPPAEAGGVSLAVGDSDCTTRDRPALDAADWSAVGVLSVVVALALASTAYDALTPQGPAKRPLLAAFSVVANGRKLLAAPRRDADASLACLHGIRVLSMCWVVLGHRYYITMTYPNLNPTFLQTFLLDWWRVGITNATVSVDTFFVVSGLLVGYLFFKQKPADRRLNLPLYYLHRYIRLTPAFAMMVLLGASLLFRTGWGPRWPALTDPTRASCQRSWWSSLLYVNNYVYPESQCVGQSWYLMVDMQLFWLSPLLLLGGARWPRAAPWAMGALCAAGVVGCFAVSLDNHLPGNLFAATDAHATMVYFRNYYIPAYTRFVPYVQGLWLGRALGERRARGCKARPLGRVASALAWLSVAALLLLPLFAGRAFLSSPAPPNAVAALYNALHRPAWALGVAGVVFLCANGNGGPAQRLLAWDGFQVLGRLSYCVFLVHMSLQTMQSAGARTYSYMADGAILAAFAGDLLSSLVLAAALSLLCEAPFLALEKVLLLPRPRAPARD
ncbi:hypothetical protein R5R35_002196 [Gryllus longicercus]|uniref:Nose resistant-to-fluoxetine protein N-terminal domain-containing protein n=1 Tax=Gryllus longicercus TaxID=2509291 RepID=A0AAN9VJR3_9ORTH